MSHHRLPPPQPEACLTLSRASRYKGGTIIAEDVWFPDEHDRRMSSPDSYRPGVCGRCGNRRLHIHDYLERKPLGAAMVAALRIVRFICANPSCGATWRVLPAFLARHLWWVWRRVEGATTSPALATAPAQVPTAPPVPLFPGPAGSAPAAATTYPAGEPATEAGSSPPERVGRYRPVPERTRARWLERLESSARQQSSRLPARPAHHRPLPRPRHVARRERAGADRRVHPLRRAGPRPRRATNPAVRCRARSGA
jgi:hypothetical protein